MENLNEWSDATTYSRYDENKVPTAWEYITPSIRIFITRNHRILHNKWVLVCPQIGVNLAAMSVAWSENPPEIEIENAKAAAIRIVKNRLQIMLSSLK